MQKIKNFIAVVWPYALLTLLSILLAYTNTQPGKYLLGWDSTTPELNLSLNLERFVFGVWQEYRGLGTHDGMAHTANIVQLIYAAVLSLIVPTETVRPLLNYLLHLAGGIGMYVLCLYLIRASTRNESVTSSVQKMSAFLGAVFYQYSLFTLQMFYLPLELFSFHFALLPWAFWALIHFFQKPTKRNLLLIGVIHFLLVSQAHVPTIVVSYGIGLVTFCGVALLTKVARVAAIAKALIIIIAVNLFWGIPYLMSTPQMAAEIAESKQNTIGTRSVFYRNNAWSTPTHLGQFGGLTLGYQDWYEENQTFMPIMRNWIPFWQSSLSRGLTTTMTLFTMFGSVFLLIYTVRARRMFLLPFVVLFFLMIVLLGTDIPGVRTISDTLREHVPLYAQIFRFTFTKFSLLYVVSFGVTFCLTTYTLLTKTLSKTWIQQSILFLAISVQLYLGHRVWLGDFFYPQLWVSVPQSYQMVADNLNNPSERVAFFPIHSLWGWTTNTTKWGYRGSGFMWQMFASPLVDRAFDPWNKHNETLYLQLSQSLYTDDIVAFFATLNKYNISHILFDASVFHPGNYPKNLYSRELTKLFSQSRQLTKVQETPELLLYKNKDGIPSLPFAPASVAHISSEYQTEYTKRDPAYALFGTYVQDADGVLFPFSYLNSDRPLESPTKSAEGYLFTIQPHKIGSLTASPLARAQRTVPLSMQLTDKGAYLTTELQLPVINGKASSLTTQNFELKQPKDTALTTLNGEFFLLSNSSRPSLSYVPTNKESTLVIYENTPFLSQEAVFETITQATNCTGVHTEVKDEAQLELCTSTTLLPPSKQKHEVLLMGIVLEYTSAQFLSPEVCVYQEEGVCLNSVLQSIYSADASKKLLTLAVTINAHKPIFIEARTAMGTQTTQYGTVQIRFHSPTHEFSIATPAALSQVDEHFSLASRTVKDSAITILIPADQNDPWSFPIEFKSRGKNDHLNCAQNQAGSIIKKIEGQTNILYNSTQGATLCDTVYLPYLNAYQQYLAQLSGKNTGGVGLKYFLTNPQTKRFDLEYITPQGDFSLTHSIWPSYKQDTRSSDVFSFDVTAESFGRENNTTHITEGSFTALPANWLSSLHFAKNQTETFSVRAVGQRHNPSLYSVQAAVDSQQALIFLPQAYNKNWLAFSLTQPFKLFEHVTVNGWANGWYIPQGTYTVYILFWPQLLSFIGYGCGAACILLIVRKKS